MNGVFIAHGSRGRQRLIIQPVDALAGADGGRPTPPGAGRLCAKHPKRRASSVDLPAGTNADLKTVIGKVETAESSPQV
jgi:hypothetical protein